MGEKKNLVDNVLHKSIVHTSRSSGAAKTHLQHQSITGGLVLRLKKLYEVLLSYKINVVAFSEYFVFVVRSAKTYTDD